MIQMQSLLNIADNRSKKRNVYKGSGGSKGVMQILATLSKLLFVKLFQLEK